MSVEGYKVTFQEVVDGVDPAKRGRKPFLKVESGASDIYVTRINPDDKKTILVFVCEKDNSESRIYSLDPESIVTRYGFGSNRRILVVDDDEDGNSEFPLRHDKTLFPNSIPMYIRAEDEEGNDAWLMLKHV